ncbi:MAG: hypothetical protein MHM6MM_002137 [Cercozoa sp. M6MM]
MRLDEGEGARLAAVQTTQVPLTPLSRKGVFGSAATLKSPSAARHYVRSIADSHSFDKTTESMSAQYDARNHFVEVVRRFGDTWEVDGQGNTVSIDRDPRKEAQKLLCSPRYASGRIPDSSSSDDTGDDSDRLGALVVSLLRTGMAVEVCTQIVAVLAAEAHLRNIRYAKVVDVSGKQGKYERAKCQFTDRKSRKSVAYASELLGVPLSLMQWILLHKHVSIPVPMREELHRLRTRPCSDPTKYDRDISESDSFASVDLTNNPSSKLHFCKTVELLIEAVEGGYCHFQQTSQYTLETPCLRHRLEAWVMQKTQYHTNGGVDIGSVTPEDMTQDDTTPRVSTQEPSDLEYVNVASRSSSTLRGGGVPPKGPRVIVDDQEELDFGNVYSSVSSESHITLTSLSHSVQREGKHVPIQVVFVPRVENEKGGMTQLISSIMREHLRLLISYNLQEAAQSAREFADRAEEQGTNVADNVESDTDRRIFVRQRDRATSLRRFVHELVTLGVHVPQKRSMRRRRQIRLAIREYVKEEERREREERVEVRVFGAPSLEEHKGDFVLRHFDRRRGYSTRRLAHELRHRLTGDIRYALSHSALRLVRSLFPRPRPTSPTQVKPSLIEWDTCALVATAAAAARNALFFCKHWIFSSTDNSDMRKDLHFHIDAQLLPRHGVCFFEDLGLGDLSYLHTLSNIETPTVAVPSEHFGQPEYGGTFFVLQFAFATSSPAAEDTLSSSLRRWCFASILRRLELNSRWRHRLPGRKFCLRYKKLFFADPRQTLPDLFGGTRGDATGIIRRAALGTSDAMVLPGKGDFEVAFSDKALRVLEIHRLLLPEINRTALSFSSETIETESEETATEILPLPPTDTLDLSAAGEKWLQQELGLDDIDPSRLLEQWSLVLSQRARRRRGKAQRLSERHEQDRSTKMAWNATDSLLEWLRRLIFGDSELPLLSVESRLVEEAEEAEEARSRDTLFSWQQVQDLLPYDHAMPAVTRATYMITSPPLSARSYSSEELAGLRERAAQELRHQREQCELHRPSGMRVLSILQDDTSTYASSLDDLRGGGLRQRPVVYVSARRWFSLAWAIAGAVFLCLGLAYRRHVVHGNALDLITCSFA